MPEEISATPMDAVPGCGLATYALLLAVLGITGVVGLGLSTVAMIGDAPKLANDLVNGREVPTWRLKPLWDAGVLTPGQVPLAWHEESAKLDGSTACALLDDAVVSVDAGKGAKVLYQDITAIRAEGAESSGMTVFIEGAGGPIDCVFGADEGGGRFQRQAQAEVDRRKAPQ